jgi:tetratricopeptide (TPR) repeat protein
MATLAHLDTMSDRTLRRLTRWGVVALVVLLAAFTALYVIGQRSGGGPTLVERNVTTMEDAVKQAPQNVQLRLKLAEAYTKAGRTDDALAQYDEVLRAVPKNSTASLGKATLLFQKGDLDSAKALFTTMAAAAKSGEFARVDPEAQTAHYYLGSIAIKQGQYDAAITELTRAKAMDGSDADVLYLLGVAQSKKGDDADAVGNLSRAVAFVPTGWCEPWAALQTSYGNLKQGEMAQYAGAMNSFCGKDSGAAVKQLEPLTSGRAALPALLGLGLITEQQGDKASAGAWYLKAYAIAPTDTTVLSSLDRLGVKPPAAGSTTTKAS